jgi:hypothetical protein
VDSHEERYDREPIPSCERRKPPLLVCTGRPAWNLAPDHLVQHTVPVSRSSLHRGLIAGLLAAAVLTACGDEATSDGSDREPDEAGASDVSARLAPRFATASVLDETRAGLAILALANLGPGFEPSSDSPAEEETEAPIEGEIACDAEVSFEDRFDPGNLALAEASEDYLYFDEARLLLVTSVVDSFGDEDTAETLFADLAEQLDDCTELGEVIGDESTEISLTVDTEPATGDVDDQLNSVGGGIWTEEGEPDFPIALGFSIARVDNNVTMTMMISLGVLEDTQLLAPYTEIAVDRLVAVAAGELPEETAAPMPTTVPPSRLPPVAGEPRTFEEFAEVAPGILG